MRLQIEMLKPEREMRRHAVHSTVVVFGSARLVSRHQALRQLATLEQPVPGQPAGADRSAQTARARKQLDYARYYEEARRFAEIVSRQFQEHERRDFVVITGGGPGIMEAANRGAHDAGARSIGLNITLAHEQAPNPFVSPQLCFRLRYFDLRKMHFLLRARALVTFPGGYGTLDELFEVLTLVQTGKMQRIPVVLDTGSTVIGDARLFSVVETAEEMAVSRDLATNLRTECLPAPVRLYARLIKLVNPSYLSDAANTSSSQNIVAKFGQSMYTPDDPTRTDLIVDDRPYAGLLYAGMAWNRRSHAAQSDVEMLDTRELTLGVIGPASLARQTQDMVHYAIGSERFLGWDHQLKNEPALQMAMARKFKRFRGDGAITPGFSADLIPAIGMRVGNIETSVGMAAEGRIGWNIPNDFGTYPIQPGAENRPPSAASIHGHSNTASRSASAPRVGVHLFGTLEGKYVAHDFSLDGNLFRSSHHVTRRPWVVQAAVGLSTQGVLGGRGYKLAVMRVYRSREFEEQTSSHTYGSVDFSVEF